MLELDHVVIGAATLPEAVKHCSEHWGVQAIEGGEHLDLGTHNALVGASDAYVELLAPLDGAHCTIDALGAYQQPTLFHYAVRTAQLETIETRAQKLGLTSGGIQTGRRRTQSGNLITWRILFLRGHDCGAAIPFFIDWQSTPRPSDQLPAQIERLMLSVRGPQLLQDLLGADTPGLDVSSGEAALSLTFSVKDQVFVLKAPTPLPRGL